MTKSFPVVLFFVILVVYFKSVKSIKCYVCRSDDNSSCAGNLDGSLVQECPRPPHASGEYCRKMEQQLYFRGEKSVTTIRECAYEKNPKQCYRSKWVEVAYQLTCECDGDMCNRSSTTAPLIFLSILMPLCAYVYAAR